MNAIKPGRPWQFDAALLAAGLPLGIAIVLLIALPAAFGILAAAVVLIGLLGVAFAATLAMIPPILTGIVFIALMMAIRKLVSAGSMAWAASKLEAERALATAREAVRWLIRLGKKPMHPRAVLVPIPLVRLPVTPYVQH
jgi:hypothetical protein